MDGLITTRLMQLDPPDPATVVLSGPFIGGNPAFEALVASNPIPDVPLDLAVLSRDPTVGGAYAADDLVYHGPLRRETLLGLFGAIEAVADGPDFGPVPTLWLHGGSDPLAHVELVRPVVERLAPHVEAHVYRGAAHEVFNEINRGEVLADLTRFLDGD